MVARVLVDDDVDVIQAAVQAQIDEGVQLVVMTGGTGLEGRDVVPEAIEPLFRRAIPGFGELFRMLSYEDVGAAAMLSRATAGMIGKAVCSRFRAPGRPVSWRSTS